MAELHTHRDHELICIPSLPHMYMNTWAQSRFVDDMLQRRHAWQKIRTRSRVTAVLKGYSKKLVRVNIPKVFAMSGPWRDTSTFIKWNRYFCAFFQTRLKHTTACLVCEMPICTPHGNSQCQLIPTRPIEWTIPIESRLRKWLSYSRKNTLFE